MKLNNLSRLTALLLALTMFLSSVAWADPVAEGDYTADNYAEMLAAQTDTCATCVNEMTNGDFPTTDHKGNTISITCSYEYLKGLGSPMERYNFLDYVYNTLLDSTGFAALYTTHEQHVEDGAASLLCTCPDRANTDLRVPGPENHAETCPWVDDTVVIIPNIPQPPVYGGDPQGKQYTSNEEYNLPMANDRAIILPEGGRAVIHSNVEAADGYQWQVYDGTQWVGIAGETGSDLVITTAKLNTIFELTGIAELRYFDKDSNIVLASVSVTSQQIAGGEYVDPVAETAQNLSLTEKADGDTVTITINYWLDGKAIYETWTSDYNYGQTVNQAVNHPTVQGYLPYIGADNKTVSSTRIDLVFDSLTENKTYDVYYRPAEVNFTVKHYLQDLDATDENPSYTLQETENKTGLTGSHYSDPATTTLELAKTYPGFYALQYSETEYIGADGLTVVEIYYDRWYYLVKFELDGGFGVEPVYDRYGSTLSVGTPTRAGYAFDGWQIKNADGTYSDVASIPGTIQVGNQTYKAKWTAQPVDYTVVFWYENADDNGYSQAGVVKMTDGTAGEQIASSTFKNTAFDNRDDSHFTYNAAREENVTLAGDGSSVINVYFTRNLYTMTFELDEDICTLDGTHTHTSTCKELVCQVTPHDHATSNCTLSCDHTVHGLSCYSATGGNGNRYLTQIDEPTMYRSSVDSNGIYTYYNSNYSQTKRYALYLDGKWYQNSNGSSSGISFNCTHSHTDSCYGCDEIAHAHSESCYKIKCGQNEHYHSNGKCIYKVVAKYDADITAVWDAPPISDVVDAGDSFQSSLNDAYYAFLEKMPGQDITMTYHDYSGGNTYWWGYYLEVLPGQDTTGLTTKTYEGKTYYEYDDRLLESNSLQLSYDEDYYPITGFKQLHAPGEGGWYVYSTNPLIYALRFSTYNNSTDRYEIFLYYTRASYELTFKNNGTTVTGNSTGVSDMGGSFLYQEDISDQYFIPDYPEDFEPNAYMFEGWYKSPYYGDTKFAFTTKDEDGNVINATMPAEDFTLYAHWVPVTHHVNFYLTKEQMDNYLDGDDETVGAQYIAQVDVPHNEYTDDVLIANNRAADATSLEMENVENGDYTFVGWFYLDDDGKEKMFDPFDMQVKKDLNLYGKWSSKVLKTYTVRYGVKNADGSWTYIADESTGSALAGMTKTVYPKGDESLYPSYQEHYFPLVQKHTITLDIDGNDDNELNVYTFEYVYVEHVPYKVHYVTKTEPDSHLGTIVIDGETCYILHETKLVPNNVKAAVTEKYEPVAGYLPDEYQKGLTLVANGTDPDGDKYSDENVIVFYYEKNENSGIYTITHYIEHPMGEDLITTDGTHWKIYDESGEVGTYGNNYTADYIEIEYYTKDEAVTEALTSGVLTKENGLALKLFYRENSVTLSYEVVAPDGVEPAEVGTVAINDNDDATTPAVKVSESVKVLTGEANGAVAEASGNTYRFVGWYDNAACTGEPLPTDALFKPKKEDGTAWPDSTTYYAKFEYNLTSMSIKKTGMSAGESAIFTVTNVEESSDTWTVVVANDATVTLYGLTVGATYSIAENGDWSWRYDATAISPQSKTIDADPTKNAVVITNVKDNDQWLSDESSIVNFDGSNQ